MLVLCGNIPDGTASNLQVNKLLQLQLLQLLHMNVIAV